jgi:ubiquinone/menaquinone biosynthesis C-methylase UbiE
MSDLAVGDHVRGKYQDYYEQGESEWRRLCAVDKADNIVSLCHKLPHSSILEIGAGEGAILKRLSDLGFGEKLHAIEISSSGVEAIRKKGIARLAECIPFDGYRIPYGDRAFDLAVLSHVLEHVEFPRQLIYEAARVAGRVFIEVPLEDTMRLRRDFVPDVVGHINWYSARTIRRLVQTCGLEVLDQIITTPSRAVHTYHRGAQGLVHYFVKRCCLKILPSLATAFCVYHSSLVCRAKS